MAMKLSRIGVVDVQFSQVNVIEKEQQLIVSKTKNRKVFERFVDFVLYRNPTYTFYFGVPTYTFMRAKAFCEDVEGRIESEFTISDLAALLFKDFLAFLKSTNNMEAIMKRLQSRNLSPVILKRNEHLELIFEEYRGFELITAKLSHKEALRGEFVLRDMLDLYKDHSFTLENVLEIIFMDFIDDYRRGFIKDPFSRIERYL
jgi:hypothetical protein